MKTFKILTAGGFKEVEQLATFTHYIQNVQFRFVITREVGAAPVVTQRASGYKVCDIPQSIIQAALGDYKSVGKSAIDALIARAGEARGQLAAHEESKC